MLGPGTILDVCSEAPGSLAGSPGVSFATVGAVAGPWDEPALRRVLNWAIELNEALAENAARVREHRDLIERAREQARPHRVHFREVTLHEACDGDGCPPCDQSGVAHISGRPFVAPVTKPVGPPAPTQHTRWGPPPAPAPPAPPTPAQLAEAQQKLAAARAAHARLQRLAEGFATLASKLEGAAHTARAVAEDLQAILGGKAP